MSSAAHKLGAEGTSSPENSEASRDLDPHDWDEFREAAHTALDDMIAHVRAIREGPVWQPAPDVSRRRFAQPLPVEPRNIHAVLDDVKAHIVPYATGNLHPRFMGWVHGAGTPVGIVAEIVAAGLNMNCGGRDHIGIEVERQIARWMQQALGYPDGASGLFLTGSSMANFLAVVIAKTEALGAETRRLGVRASDHQLTAYASIEAHGCVAKAMDLSGLGSANLRRIPVDAAGGMDVAALEDAIAMDRSSGMRPFLVVATAGTVNTSALDPLDRLADVAAHEKLWFHVDGAIGALATFSPVLRPLLGGIERSDSVALDFHKWGHVPYDAGFLLVRDGQKHRAAFENPAAYLQRAERGLAAGAIWPCDLGLDLSRGFRALKTWMTIETLGTARIGDAILHTCELARYLAERIGASDLFELKAPVSLNIVCFGIKGAGGGSINRELVLDLQESGIAAPSWTTIAAETVIRCAIVNHRTTRTDIDVVFDNLLARAEARLTSPAR